MEYTEITDYKTACQNIGEDPDNLPDVSKLSEEEGKDVINTVMLKRVIRALNKDPKTGKIWEPNWNDHGEYKYSPWLEVEASADKPGGFGFSRSLYVLWSSYSYAGSRLCLSSSDKVLHLIKHFKDLLIATYLILR